jgi:hypothetical protein
VIGAKQKLKLTIFAEFERSSFFAGELDKDETKLFFLISGVFFYSLFCELEGLE